MFEEVAAFVVQLFLFQRDGKRRFTGTGASHSNHVGVVRQKADFVEVAYLHLIDR